VGNSQETVKLLRWDGAAIPIQASGMVERYFVHLRHETGKIMRLLPIASRRGASLRIFA
jgi:hypothetical protein